MSAVTGALGLPPERIEAVLQAAIRAPSWGDGQPCRFRVTDKAIEMHGDRQGCPAEVWGRVGLVCGGALFNLRLALEQAGVRPLVTLMPDGSRSMLFAVVRGGGRITITRQRARLYRMIAAPGTSDRPGQPVSEEDQRALVRAAQEERCWLHIIKDGSQCANLRKLADYAHDLRTAEPEACTEDRLAKDRAVWKGDAALASPAVGGPEAVLAVLCSFYLGPLAEVQAGQALQRTVLTAASSGLMASCLPEVVEVASTREALRTLLPGNTIPQMVLSLRYSASVPAVPERAVTEALWPETP